MGNKPLVWPLGLGPTAHVLAFVYGLYNFYSGHSAWPVAIVLANIKNNILALGLRPKG